MVSNRNFGKTATAKQKHEMKSVLWCSYQMSIKHLDRFTKPEYFAKWENEIET